MLFKFDCSRLKPHLPIQSIQLYGRELQSRSKAPHFHVEIHDVVGFPVASPLLLQHPLVNAMYIGRDCSQLFDIDGNINHQVVNFIIRHTLSPLFP